MKKLILTILVVSCVICPVMAQDEGHERHVKKDREEQVTHHKKNSDEHHQMIVPRQQREVNVKENNRADVQVNRNSHRVVTTKTFTNVTRVERPHSDFHFSVGLHPRAWWLERYDVVLINGCYFYYDDGFYYPAYGFDPNCAYDNEYIVIQAD